jgi:hypothetical protein
MRGSNDRPGRRHAPRLRTAPSTRNAATTVITVTTPSSPERNISGIQWSLVAHRAAAWQADIEQCARRSCWRCGSIHDPVGCHPVPATSAWGHLSASFDSCIQRHCHRSPVRECPSVGHQVGGHAAAASLRPRCSRSSAVIRCCAKRHWQQHEPAINASAGCTCWSRSIRAICASHAGRAQQTCRGHRRSMFRTCGGLHCAVCSDDATPSPAGLSGTASARNCG